MSREETTDRIIQRIEGLANQDAKLQDLREKERLARQIFNLLPQGPDSRLDADLLDGLHADEIIARARTGVTGGGGAVNALRIHGSQKHDHTAWYAVITPAGAILPAANPADLQLITGTNFTYYVLDFDQATAESIGGQFRLPPHYLAGTDLLVTIEWISTLIAGDVKWGAQILGRAEGETFDAAMSAEATVTTTTNGTAGKKNVSTITINNPDLVAEDTFILKIRRVAADVADTHAGDARFVMAGVRL